jgi:hypothetical protein
MRFTSDGRMNRACAIFLRARHLPQKAKAFNIVWSNRFRFLVDPTASVESFLLSIFESLLVLLRSFA